MSGVMCQVSHVIFFLRQSSGANRWRVCYQSSHSKDKFPAISSHQHVSPNRFIKMSVLSVLSVVSVPSILSVVSVVFVDSVVSVVSVVSVLL